METTSNNCDPCQVRSKMSSGVKFCSTCQETYCDECAEVHRSSKSSKRHVLVNIKDLRLTSVVELALQGIQKCSRHPEKHIEFFCKKHNLLICSYCLLQHRMAEDCDVVVVVDADEAILKSDYVEKVKTDLQTVTHQLEDERQRIENHLTSSNMSYLNIQEKLRETRAVTLDLFDQLEKSIMFVVTCDAARENRELQNLLAKINQLLVRVNDAAQLLKSTSDSGSSPDMFKCILLIGQFLESYVLAYQNTKREPIWIRHNSLLISTELGILLNKTRNIIERHKSYTLFSRSECAPLKTTFTELLNIIDQYNSDCACKTDSTPDQNMIETASFSKLDTKSSSKHGDQTEQDMTVKLQKESCDEAKKMPQLLKSTHRFATTKQMETYQKQTEDKPISEQVKVIKEISPDNGFDTNTCELPAQFGKTPAFGGNDNDGLIDNHENSNPLKADKEGEVNAKCLEKNENTNDINFNEVDVLNSLHNETYNTRGKGPIENECVLEENITNNYGQTIIVQKQHPCDETQKKNKNKTHKSQKCYLQKEENISTLINKADTIHDTSVNSHSNEVNEDKKMIDGDRRGTHDSRHERMDKNGTKVKTQHEPGRNDYEVFEVPGKSKSSPEFDIKSESSIEIPMRGIKEFDISVMTPSDDIIIVCDYHNSKLIKLETKYHGLKETLQLRANIVHANLLKGQMIAAACHNKKAKVLLYEYTPSFKLIRALDTQYEADAIQSVDDDNMLVSMWDSSGFCHLHIISLTGQLKEKVKLSKSIEEPFSLEVLSSNDFRFGYRILQSCLATNTLYCFEKDGKDIFKYKMKSPDCVAVHDSGFIFVTERIGRIHVLSSSGQKVCETKCCSDVTSIAVTPSMDKILLTRFRDKRISVLSIDLNFKSVS